MHSCESIPPPQPASGASLLQQLGRLIIRARSRSPARTQPPAADARDRLLKAKLLKNQPSTSQVCTQPRSSAEPRPAVEAQLDSHVQALWTEQIPICIEVLLAPDCPECFAKLSKIESEAAYDKSPHSERRGLLLERWTMSLLLKKGHEASSFITSQWLLSGIRSQLHFSQLSAWLARLYPAAEARRRTTDSTERRRKLSRETCNFKKLESNCDVEDLPKSTEEQTSNGRRLNVVYSIKIPGETYKMSDFSKPPTDHTFPITDIGNNVYLKVILQSLPRTDDIPKLKCNCTQTQPKRRASKEMPINTHEEIMKRMNDLTLGPNEDFRSHYNNDINSNIGSSSSLQPENNLVVDDRMHTTCSEKGKHRCNCDDESDQGKDVLKKTKSLDERRLKEIAKYKRRLRKESKFRKIRDSNSESTGNEGDTEKKRSESHTSIPILQAARFDRFRAIGCYRNQTYLTLPASRIESKSPFMVESPTEPEFKKTNSVGTQTDLKCDCGSQFILKCEDCCRGMVRSEANYNLSSIDNRRKHEGTESLNKKLKCDNNPNNSTCDNINLSNTRKCSDGLIKRPKLKGLISSRLEKIVSDRNGSDVRVSKQLEKNESDRNGADNGVSKRLYKIESDRTGWDGGVSKYLENIESDRNGADSGVSKRLDKIVIDRTGSDDGVYNRLEKIESDRNGADNGVSKRLDKIVSDSTGSDNGVFKRLEKAVSGRNGSDNSVSNCLEKIERNCLSHSKDIDDLHLKDDDTVFVDMKRKPEKRQKHSSIGDEDYSVYEKCYYGTFDRFEAESPGDSPQPTFEFPSRSDSAVPSSSEVDKFRWRFDSAASMVFHTKTGLPLTSSPAPLKRGSHCFDFDDSINGINGIKSALSHRARAPRPRPPPPAPRAPQAALLGTFEESALKGRLEPVATVHGFTAELAACGAFCPPHRKLPVTVFFYAPGGTNAPYMGHINLGASGYRVPNSGTVQVSLFNPHGTLVKMFVVLYELRAMPPCARTFLRQRTLYLPAGSPQPPQGETHKYMRYLIHLRFMTSSSGKLYLHTDIRIIVSRKADIDTAQTALRDQPTNNNRPSANHSGASNKPANQEAGKAKTANSKPCRVFGGCSDFKDFELGYENQNGVSYELRSFTYGPENPKYSPR